MKKGERYIHPDFMDGANRPLLVQVTSIRGDRVYWRPVNRFPTRETLGNLWYTLLNETSNWKTVR